MPGDGQVQIPGFRIAHELGRGAMGVVYHAHEESLGREVALKVLRASYGDTEDLRARFEREVRAAARLRHPNIVPILSTGEAQGRLWYAMDFIAGDTLEDLLGKSPQGRMRRARAARIVRDVARALHAAHESGVIHRDVKPGNVMLVEQPAPPDERTTRSRRLRRSWLGDSDSVGNRSVYRPLLADFGLAADRTASKLSESGMLIGTPGYMGPEQFRGEADEIGPHSDQWALGVLLYECLTGRMPFPTSDLPTLARMVGNDEPITPSRLDPRIDRDLETITLKCLQKNPRDRYPDCAALSDDLGHWLREEPINARPPGPTRRLQAWARRRPARATALATLVFLALIAAGVGIGVRISKANRVAELDREARQAMRDARWADAEATYEEWIALDPGAPEPRDGRTRVRGLRNVSAALVMYKEARSTMERLAEGRQVLEFLEAQSREGKETEGGRGLGERHARGSEPWWMREPAYGARMGIARLREKLTRERAKISATLAIARSQADTTLEWAGEEGRSARQQIYAGSAEWHMAEWRDAVAHDDPGRAALHRYEVERLANELNPAPSYLAELSGRRTVVIRATTPPADVWLFRYQREADVIERGGPRLLPLPFHPEHEDTPVPETYRDAVAKRLESEGRRRVAPDIATLSPRLQSTETYIDTLAGRMRRDKYETLLASSAYPLETSIQNALGTLDKDISVDLRPGRYLLLLRRPGVADERIPFAIGREPLAPIEPGEARYAVIPPGFVLVSGENPFLASRYEVTYADYWEFLNDSRTLGAIQAHAGVALRFVPRSAGRFPRPEDGALSPRLNNRYRPMDNPEHPVSHLNFYDLVGYLAPPEGEDEPRDDQYNALARALERSETVDWGYLRWRTERSRERARLVAKTGELLPDVVMVRTIEGKLEPRAMRFTLPTEAEWVRMARGADRRVYVYGDEREWLYFKGVRSRPYYPAPEAVGLFPNDESVFGVRDLTGSVSEWTADWQEAGGVFRVKGHAWGSQASDDDRIDGYGVLAPDVVSSTVGIRLVVRALERP